MSGELGAYQIVVGNMGDRNDLELWWQGGSLVSFFPLTFCYLSNPNGIQVQKVAAVCSNTIVVVHSVGPVYMPWSTHPNVTGIIYAGAPGEQTGPSIVDVLSGAFNPRGRLPFSIADVSWIFNNCTTRMLGYSITLRTKQLMAQESCMIVWMASRP